MFQFYIKRILKSPLFWICVGAALIFWITGCISGLKYVRTDPHNILYILRTSYAFGMVLVLAPVLMSIPFIMFFVEELQKKLIFYQMVRTNYKKYYQSQIFSALLSAALVSAISIAIYSIILLAAGAVFDPVECNYFDGTGMEAIFYSSKMWLLYVWYCVAFVLFCMPWIMFTLVFSLFTTNKYVLISAPFVCFFGMNYILEAFYPVFPQIIWFIPPQTMLSGKLIYAEFWNMGLSILYPLLYHGILITVLASVYYLVSKRRFLHEGV